MKPIRNILLTSLIATLALFSVIYTSCNKNKCHNVTCLNQGTCDGGYCVCPRGFEGNRCQTLSREKFIATYNGGDSCHDATTPNHFTQYPVHLLSRLNDSTEMVLTNLLDDPSDSAICTIQTTDSFTFIGSNNSTTFTGTGKMRNDSLWMIYHVVHSVYSYDCAYFGQSLR